MEKSEGRTQIEKVKVKVFMDWKPTTEVWSVTWHMGSHSVTCHRTQVNSSRAGRYSIYLPRRDGRLS